MRRYADILAAAPVDPRAQDIARLLREYADRIEAAYKREHADWHAETDAAKDDRNRVACRMRREFAEKCRNCTERAPGNAAAMRDALWRIRDLVREIQNGGRISPGAFISIIGDALAAPARNCDRFATELDARLAWKRETHCTGDYRYWLFAPAEGGAE